MTLSEKLLKESLEGIEKIIVFNGKESITSNIPFDDIPKELLKRKVYAYEFDYINRKYIVWLADD